MDVIVYGCLLPVLYLLYVFREEYNAYFAKEENSLTAAARTVLLCATAGSLYILLPILNFGFDTSTNWLNRKRKFYGEVLDAFRRPVIFSIVVALSVTAVFQLSPTERITLIFEKLEMSLWIVALVKALNNLFHCLVIEFVAPHLHSRYLDSDGNEKEKHGDALDDRVVTALRHLIVVTIWSSGVLSIAHHWGISLSAALYGAGAGGLAFALAAKDSLSNLLAGLFLFFDKPFNIGDRVLLKGFDGAVKDIGLRSTRLVLRNGRMLTIPNSEVANALIENVTSEGHGKRQRPESLQPSSVGKTVHGASSRMRPPAAPMLPAIDPRHWQCS